MKERIDRLVSRDGRFYQVVVRLNDFGEIVGEREEPIKELAITYEDFEPSEDLRSLAPVYVLIGLLLVFAFVVILLLGKQ